MLERNNADDFVKKPLPVVLVMDSGESYDGDLYVCLSGNLFDELNNEKDFVEFHDEEGVERFVAKSRISSIIPKVRQRVRKC